MGSQPRAPSACPQHEAEHGPVQQPRTRIGDKEAIGSDESRRHPTSTSVVEEDASAEVGQDDGLQTEDHGHEAPAHGVVAEEHHADRNEQLAEGRMVIGIGAADAVAMGCLDEGLLVEGEPIGPPETFDA